MIKQQRERERGKVSSIVFSTRVLVEIRSRSFAFVSQYECVFFSLSVVGWRSWRWRVPHQSERLQTENRDKIRQKERVDRKKDKGELKGNYRHVAAQ